MDRKQCCQCRSWHRWPAKDNHPEVGLHGDCRVRSPRLVMESRLREVETRSVTESGRMDVTGRAQVRMNSAVTKWPSTRFDTVACGEFESADGGEA